MIKINSQNTALEKVKSELLVICCLSGDIGKAGDGRRSKVSSGNITLSSVDALLNGAVKTRLEQEQFKVKAGSHKLVQIHGSQVAHSVLVIGIADKKQSDNFDVSEFYRKLGATVFSAAQRTKAKEIAIADTHLDLKKATNLQALIEGLLLTGYTFNRYKSKSDSSAHQLERVTILSSKALSKAAINAAHCVVDAVKLARDLVNTPARDMRPRDLVAAAKGVARETGLKCEVLDKRALERMGAKLLLAVSEGSSEPPYLIKLTYRPKKRATSSVALIGKGITFDSGGLSIKPGASMETMKCDMSGAAAVISAMWAIARLKPSVEVRAYIPTCENMINGAAVRPGDVVTGLAGKSVEILNTDAEGRLILADALTVAVKEKSRYYIDLATLTGACVVALGGSYAGLFSTDQKLASKLQRAAEAAGERLWQLPLALEYEKLIKSPIADIKNTGGRAGGAITAALFLKHFVDDADWAHIDIAGPAFIDAADGYLTKGGTGFGVRTITNFVMEL